MSLCDFGSSWFSSMVATLMGHPFDTISVRAETRGINAMTAAKQIRLQRGFRGYFRGALAPVLVSGGNNSMFLMVYGRIIDFILADREEIDEEIDQLGDRMHLYKHKGQHLTHPQQKSQDARTTTLDCVIAGSIASTGQVALGCPTDVVKTMLQNQQRKNTLKGPMQCCKHIFKEKGIPGFYVGWQTMAARNVVYGLVSTAWLVTFYNRVSVSADQWWILLPVSGVSTILSTVASTPFDVVKSRLQAQDPHCPKYKGFWDCFVRTFRKQGYVGFYRGLIAGLLRSIPTEAAYYISNEYIHAYSTFCAGNKHGDLYFYMHPKIQSQ